jgi:predicted dehydrogenase
MFSTLIVGFGHAGRNLHLPCLAKARAAEPGLFGAVGVVEPAPVESPLPRFADLTDVSGFPSERTIVHVCTPPADHATTLCRLAQMGFRRVVTEKPLAESADELPRIRRACAEQALDLLVVANWLHSTLTDRIRALLRSGRLAPVVEVKSQQHKPRFARTLASRSHATAFDVELPHQVALALDLFGSPAAVASATVTSMHAAGREVPFMGSAQIELLHPGGVRSTLTSDLATFRRVRSLEITCARGRLLGHYPIDAGEGFAGLSIQTADCRAAEEVFEDDPLTACFTDFYRHFAGRGPRPASDLTFNASVISVLEEAKRLAGVPRP